MSIRASKISPIEGIKEKVPCKRCGHDISNRSDRPQYCGSCVSVLRTDGDDYFKNLVPESRPRLEYKPRNVKGVNQHSKAS